MARLPRLLITSGGNMNQSFELLPFGGAGEPEGELEQERYLGRAGYRASTRYGARPLATPRYGARRTAYAPGALGARRPGYHYGTARPAHGYGRTQAAYRVGQARPGYRYGQARPLLSRSYMSYRRPYIGGYYAGALPTIPLP